MLPSFSSPQRSRDTPFMLSDFTVTSFATLFVAIGPIDTAIVFGGLTAGVHRPYMEA
jgi:hypothetical protein